MITNPLCIRRASIGMPTSSIAPMKVFGEILPAAQVDVFTVPWRLRTSALRARPRADGRYASIAAAAFVVDGGIYWHDFVAQAVVDGLMRVCSTPACRSSRCRSRRTTIRRRSP